VLAIGGEFNLHFMNQLQGKEREIEVNAMIDIAVETLSIDKEQATKRVNALLLAIDNGLFDGIPNNGPSDFMQEMFVRVKTEQIMGTHID
jgi:hypothetical protein